MTHPEIEATSRAMNISDSRAGTDGGSERDRKGVGNSQKDFCRAESSVVQYEGIGVVTQE